MIKIDNSLLEEIGLGGLPAHEKDSLLKHIYETLEMRVGMRLADQMTNQQLDEFERYFEAKDDAGAFKWLETNFPNYKDVVQEEFDKLKGEVKTAAPQILAAAAAAPAPQPPYVPPATSTPQPPVAPPVPPAPAQPPSVVPPAAPVTPQFQPPVAPVTPQMPVPPPQQPPFPPAFGGNPQPPLPPMPSAPSDDSQPPADPAGPLPPPTPPTYPTQPPTYGDPGQQPPAGPGNF